MSTPTVTETTRRPEPVDHDTFIDELTDSRTPVRSSLTTGPALERADGAGYAAR